METQKVLGAAFGGQPFQRILSSFTKATGLRAVLVDLEGTILCAPSELEVPAFCRLVGSSPMGRFRCQRSYRMAGTQSMRYAGPYIFRCHAGLVAWAAPVAPDGHHLATIICGQVLMWEPEDFFWEEIKVMTRSLKADLSHLISAAKNLEVISAQRVQAAAELVYLVGDQLAGATVELSRNKEELQAREAELRDAVKATQRADRALARLRSRAAFLALRSRQTIPLRCVRGGQAEEAASATAEFLAQVLELYSGDPRVFRIQAVELVITLMWAAVESGVGLETAVSLCHRRLLFLVESGPVAEICSNLPTYAKECAALVGAARDHPPDALIARAVEFIKCNQDCQVTVPILADQVHLSPSGLGKLFRRELDCTASDFIHRVKMDQAKRMLADPQYTVRHVGRALGFSDSSYFSKVFRHHEGISPSDYRRSVPWGEPLWPIS